MGSIDLTAVVAVLLLGISSQWESQKKTPTWYAGYVIWSAGSVASWLLSFQTGMALAAQGHGGAGLVVIPLMLTASMKFRAYSARKARFS